MNFSTRINQEGNYSHGLEKIYQLERVDPKSIRLMSGDTKKEVLASPTQLFKEEPAFNLPFAPKFSGMIPSQTLLETLDKEEVPNPLLSQLRKEGFLTKGDLARKGEAYFRQRRGLPPHFCARVRLLEELYRSNGVSKWYLASWLKRMGGGCEPFSYLVFLENLGLAQVLLPSLFEVKELEKLSSNQKKEVFNQVFLKLKEKRGEIFQFFEMVLDAFVLSWVESRGGVTTRQEIFERLQKFILGPGTAREAFGFVELFSPEKETFWKEFSGGIIVLTEANRIKVEKLLDLLRSYFYRPGVAYALTDLHFYFQREWLSSGEKVDLTTLERFLLLSPFFHLRRRGKNDWSVSLKDGSFLS